MAAVDAQASEPLLNESEGTTNEEPTATPAVEELNPKTIRADFNGVTGALAITTGLPTLIYVLYYALDAVPDAKVFDLCALEGYLIWFFGLVGLFYIVPGRVIDGTTLRDGTHLKYKMNGVNCFLVVLAVLIARGFITQGQLPELVFVADHLLGLITASIGFAFVLAFFVYFKSFGNPKTILAYGGNTGKPIFDWFIGRELNPRMGMFDIKLFCELRPGLFLWVIINAAEAHLQYRKFGYISDSMILVNIFQFIYVIDSAVLEAKNLTMIDITTDGFGFMLAFGDLALVPFTYTLQTRFLATHPVNLGWLGVVGIVALKSIGYYIFRSSNSEKNSFRQGDPSVAHLKYIETKSGSKLLISGWWGVTRHINYFGDWLMSIAWCVPTGFYTPVTYFYSLYFAILLIHRESRDEAKCSEKYGDDWKEYKRIVRWKIVPYVY
ncbi:ergosterol biosynthesis ERG4/ERG24 [Lipomyces tetrasporus]|uniref:Delta(14)-sterol reductase n=1 Tax=Lipomyces tetrasporus TaxID=54092 RepID=A0AAD7QYJ5_9ASCO|nr:ergosterol biosynthesis ERG4/ERG24 [Lipomyces tetrasporus]KAJ8103814.1 ergosterol biosynthesis ERG4/ERG24 [Lipomyces tetrasporus]